MQRVQEWMLAERGAAQALVDSQPSQKGRGDQRVCRKALHHGRWKLTQSNSGSGERAVSGYRFAVFLAQHERRSDAPASILSGLGLEIPIDGFDSAGVVRRASVTLFLVPAAPCFCVVFRPLTGGTIGADRDPRCSIERIAFFSALRKYQPGSGLGADRHRCAR